MIELLQIESKVYKLTFLAVLDKDNYDILKEFKWTIRRGGKRGTFYAHTKENKPSLMHRCVKGGFNPTLQCHHEDGNGLNNCEDNLILLNETEHFNKHHKKVIKNPCTKLLKHPKFKPKLNNVQQKPDLSTEKIQETKWMKVLF